MKLWQLLTIGTVALATSVGFVSQSPAKLVPSFAKLTHGQTIEIEFRSSGCFRSEHYAFRFVNDNGLRVDVSSFKFDPRSREEVPHPIGSHRLKKNDVIALDGLLKFYRTKPEGHCTTVDTIQMTIKNGDKSEVTETFRDATCSASNSEMLKLSDLISLIKKDGDAQTFPSLEAS